MVKTLARRTPLRFAAALALLVASVHAWSQATVDKSVGKLLDCQKPQSGIDAEGDCKLTFAVGQGSTQVVWVRSGASSCGDLSVREVISIGAAAPGGVIPPALADRLLQFNAQSKLGARARHAVHVVSIARVPIDLEGKWLAAAIEPVARSADEVERELGTADAS